MFNEKEQELSVEQPKKANLSNVALLIIDVQQGLFRKSTPIYKRVILVRDGHSNYNKQAANLIEEWNQKLSTEMVELKSTSEIAFR